MGLVEAWGGNALGWFFANIIEAYYNIALAIFSPGQWLSWVTWTNTPEEKQALMRFIFYGGSVEFFFAVFVLSATVFVVGIWRNAFLWGCVRVMEGMANWIGRAAAWFGLIMVLQQVLVVFMQRVFATSQISLGIGETFTRDIIWWSEGLKFYNAIIVCLCVTYTFVQGGHVRVDLIYAAVKFRTKKVIDMFGCLIFMIPSAVIFWMYGWFFLWRNLVTPKPNATEDLDRLLNKSRALRWNVERELNPGGFDAYFLFKLLLVTFAGLIFIQAVAFFYRSYLEYREGEISENKYLDKDTLGDGEDAYEGAH